MKIKVPEITAYRLEEATAILEKHSIKFCIREVSFLPFLRKTKKYAISKNKNKTTKNDYRVLKQTLLPDNILELIIAREIT